MLMCHIIQHGERKLSHFLHSNFDGLKLQYENLHLLDLFLVNLEIQVLRNNVIYVRFYISFISRKISAMNELNIYVYLLPDT